MVGLPLLTFFLGGGEGGGSSTFNAKQCCAAKRLFFSYSRYGFELSFYFEQFFHVLFRLINWNLFSCSECLCLLAFFANEKYLCCFSYLFREILITLKMSSCKIYH